MTPSNSFAADRGQRRTLFALLAVVAFGAMALMGYLIWSGYRDAIQEAETKTRNYAAIIEARLDATLRRADAALLERVRMIPLAAASKQALPRYAREQNAGLDFRLTNFPELDRLQVFDANGDQLYSSDRATTPFTNIVDRGYFRRLRDNPQAGLVFSEVVIARATGRESLYVSRALQDGHGAFRGVVTAGLRLEHFRKLFQSLDLGAHGVVSIYRSDDFTPVVRWPPGDVKTAVPLPPGNPTRAALAGGRKTATIEVSASSDGAVRIYSSHALDRYPFFVSAGLARDDALVGWRAHALTMGLSGLLLLGLLVGLLSRLWHAQARQAQAIADLGESEGRFRVLFEQAAVGVAMSEIATGRFVRVNRKYADILGYSPEEILQLDFRSLTHPDDLSTHLAARAPFMAGTVSEFTVDKRYVRKDSSIIWAKLTVSQLRVPGRAPTHHIGVLEDISERKRAEEALRESEQELRAIFDGALDGILVADMETRKFVAANLAICGMLGYTHEEILRVGVSDIHPKQDLPRAIKQFERLVRGETQLAANISLIRKDGSIFYTDIKASPIRIEGKHCLLGMFRDITERVQAERELVESEARFRSLVEQSIAGTYIIQDGRFAYVNPRFAQIFGYASAEEVIGCDPLSLVAENERDIVGENLRRKVEGETASIDYDFTGVRKDGSTIDVGVHGARASHRGRPAIIGLIQDISEKKRAETALRESEARFRSLTEMSSDFYWETDVEHRLTKLSSGGKARGVPALQQGVRIGKRRWEMPYLAPDEAGWQAHRVTLDARQPFRDFEFSRLDADDTERHVSVSGDPVFDASGAFGGYRGVGTDITESKRAEQALRAAEAELRLIADNVPAMIASTDAAGRYRYANRQYVEFHFGEAVSLVGRRMSDALDAEAIAWARPARERALAGEAQRYEVERRARSGEPRLLDITLVPQVDQGTVIGVYAFLLDVTERARREQAERQRAALEAANEELNAFSYTVAHDLRAPLRAIVGFSGILRESDGERLSADGERSLVRVETGARRMHDLIEGLLHYARSAQVALALGDLDLGALAAEVVEELRALYPAALIRLDELPRARGDRSSLRAVLANLIGNALKFSAMRAEPLIEIGTTNTGRGPAVFVRDNGAGFDPQYAGRLFGVFQRLHKESEFPGTGIGLAFARRVVARHGGRIWAESAPDRGATFFFTLASKPPG